MVRIQRRPKGTPTRRVRTDSAHAAWQALRADIKGKQGESIVRETLASCGLPTLHDVHLPSMTGPGFTQIDHLVLLPDAVMVIETKHYSGRLSGHPADRWWRQRVGTEKDGRLVLSPVHQNMGHCAAVRAVVAPIALDFQVVSRVVLTGSAETDPMLAECVLNPEILAGEIRAATHRAPHASRTRIWDHIMVTQRKRPVASV
ncbi:NERD domain-containing protein [Acetobacter sicerae]|nr:nuclease-related domain-containing protein [Acetobacter sicerae]NHN93559.1 NERD domain-containing protein [Acetobacter sicerae]